MAVTAEFIGFLIAIIGLAVLIGTLVSGTVRIAAFVVLVLFALVILRERFGVFSGGVIPATTTGGGGGIARTIASSPANFFGAMILFAGMAALIGTLVKGVVRNIGFVIVALLALLTLSPAIQTQISQIPFFNQSSQTQFSSPGGAGIQSVPNTTNPGTGNGQINPGSGGAGGSSPITPASPGQGTSGQPPRSLPALW